MMSSQNNPMNGMYGVNRGGVGSFVASIIGFQDVIAQTLKNDQLIKNIKVGFNKNMKGGQVDQIAINNLYAQFQRSTLNVRELYALMMSIRSVYIVNAIIECLVSDALAVNAQTGEMFTLEVSPDHVAHKKANKILSEMRTRVNLDELIKIIAPEAVFYGEYFLTPEIDEKKKQVVKVLDNVMPGSCFAIYEGTMPQYYFKIRPGTGVLETNQVLETLDVNELWHVSIWPEKISLTFDPNWVKPIKDQQLSHYIRVGQPLFFSTYDKILELVGFEKGQLAKELADIRRQSLVGVTAPEGLDLDQLSVFTEYYEGILNNVNYEGMNNPSGIDALNQTMMDLGRIRVIPQQPSRGEINPIDTRHPGNGETATSVEDRRSLICSAVCVPPEYIFNDRGDDARGSLRKFVRYARKVSDIQYGIGKAIKLLAMTELKLNGITVDDSDILVNFNSSINIQELDQLEFMDAKISMISNAKEFLQSMGEDESLGAYVDKKELVKWIKGHFSNIQGAEKLIRDPDEVENDAKSDFKIVDPESTDQSVQEPSAANAYSA